MLLSAAPPALGRTGTARSGPATRGAVPGLAPADGRRAVSPGRRDPHVPAVPALLVAGGRGNRRADELRRGAEAGDLPHPLHRDRADRQHDVRVRRAPAPRHHPPAARHPGKAGRTGRGHRAAAGGRGPAGGDRRRPGRDLGPPAASDRAAARGRGGPGAASGTGAGHHDRAAVPGGRAGGRAGLPGSRPRPDDYGGPGRGGRVHHRGPARRTHGGHRGHHPGARRPVGHQPARLGHDDGNGAVLGRDLRAPVPAQPGRPAASVAMDAGGSGGGHRRAARLALVGGRRDSDRLPRRVNHAARAPPVVLAARRRPARHRSRAGRVLPRVRH